jgi:hypothetical protein
MLPKGFPRNPGELPISSSPWEVPIAKGNRRRSGKVDEQSYDPVVPVKVGNRRASARSGHGTHWREGGNKQTYLPKENIGETQNSNCYVHKTRQTI